MIEHARRQGMVACARGYAGSGMPGSSATPVVFYTGPSGPAGRAFERRDFFDHRSVVRE